MVFAAVKWRKSWQKQLTRFTMEVEARGGARTIGLEWSTAEILSEKCLEEVRWRKRNEDAI